MEKKKSIIAFSSGGEGHILFPFVSHRYQIVNCINDSLYILKLFPFLPSNTDNRICKITQRDKYNQQADQQEINSWKDGWANG